MPLLITAPCTGQCEQSGWLHNPGRCELTNGLKGGRHISYISSYQWLGSCRNVYQESERDCWRAICVFTCIASTAAGLVQDSLGMGICKDLCAWDELAKACTRSKRMPDL